jgi:hypothetical protein
MNKKKGILLLLLLIMATLIESADNMDEVYIPSFDSAFLLNQNKIAATTQNAYFKKLSVDSLLSCWMEWHLASMRCTSSRRA